MLLNKSMVAACVSFAALMPMAHLSAAPKASPSAEWWLTTSDKSALFAKQETALAFSAPQASTKLTADATAAPATITVDPSKTYQTIDGFGFALTGGSAQWLFKMSAGARHELLQELFATDNGNIGVSYLRITIGSSDLNDHTFSYDDVPAGQTDPDLKQFSLAEDDQYLVPVLKEILAINPSIKILASPWSAPVWMKTNGNIKAGQLKEECYPVYARYLAKYVEGMKTRGIDIDAITPQNEPLNKNNTPSMEVTADEELKFVKEDMGPTFQAEGLKTKIIVWDHNCDVPQYPMTILADPDAAKYVDGSGFHLYGGSITALAGLHDAHPDKNVYFTEQMVVDNWGWKPARSVASVLIGATRNWSRNVILWNLAANTAMEPHTPNGGCPICEGAVSIDGDTVQRNVAYYSVAHFSKFVRPGSTRIDSTDIDGLSNVAFHTPDGKTVLIVSNTAKIGQTFDVDCAGKSIHPTLPAGSVGTFVW